jgi:hypothetical protein
MSSPSPSRVALRFLEAGAIILYDQDDNPANSEIKQPGSDVNYRAQGPTTYSLTPDGRPGEPAGEALPSNQTENVPPASSRVIPDQMKETLHDQLTYMKSACPKRAAVRRALLPEAPTDENDLPDHRLEPEGGEGSQLPGVEKEAALMTRLLRGTVLYHGTPYGKRFVHPKGPAWFTPDKDVTEQFTDSSWSPRAQAWAEKIEKNPRRLKFRLKKEIKLPWIGPPFDARKAGVLAGYAAKVMDEPKKDLAWAIEELGTSSGELWGWFEGRHEWYDEKDQGGVEVAKRLSERFEGVVEFMRFLCAEAAFEGWIQRYDGGGSEIALCDPKSLLRPAAQQPVRDPKMNRRKRTELLEKELLEKAKREKQWALRLERELEREAERDVQDKLRYDVLSSIMGWAEPGELDYSDPKFQKARKNWTGLVSPRQLGYRADNWDDAHASGFYGLRASSNKVAAARIDQIMGNCGPEIVERSGKVKYKRKRRAPSGMSTWIAQSVDSPKQYTIKVKPIRKRKNVKAWAKMPVQVSCSCPYFRWQGPEHWAKTNSYLYGKPVGTGSKPVIKDPKGKHWACKHVYAVLKLAQNWRFASTGGPDVLDFYEVSPLPDARRVAHRFLLLPR